MIVITKVEFVNTERTVYELLLREGNPVFTKEDLDDFSYTGDCVEVPKELITGITYRRPTDGAPVLIGASKEAQTILGLMYDETIRIREACNSFRLGEQRYKKLCDTLENSSILSRIKWVFTGIPIGKFSDIYGIR